MTADLFCDPHGEKCREWNPDPAFAHRFFTLDKAMAGARVFLELHNRPLEVLTFADAVNEFDAATAGTAEQRRRAAWRASSLRAELGVTNSWNWQETNP